ncbi:SDR family oxidoreductase [Thalassospira lucentensis]|uniref:SDR family oxidoreductase n=1 Tax=Thalassospira lucentensis TaxID=168935 RepID=UPI00399D64A5
MKIVVIGGSGLIGSGLVSSLQHDGYNVIAASPSKGVNTITGEGLTEALSNAQVVVDVSNAPSFENRAAMKFFKTSCSNLLTAEAIAGVQHHIALSVVGTERLLESGYFRAKKAQEDLIKASRIPYTILRSTQFFEFASSIVKSIPGEDVIRLSPALIQPVASEEVIATLAKLAIASPQNTTVEIAGPEVYQLDNFIRTFLNAEGRKHQVIADIYARYFGAALNYRTLTPSKLPHLGSIRFADWLNRAVSSKTKSEALR